MANAEKTINDNVLPYVTEVGAYDIIKNNQEDKDILSAMKSKVTMVSARADFDEIYDKKFPDTEAEDGADTTVTDPATQPEAEVKPEAEVTNPTETTETVTPAADPAPKAASKAAPKTKTTKTTKPADEISVEDKK